jgi:hypothetical protein
MPWTRALAHAAEAVLSTPRPLPDAAIQALTALLARRQQVATMLAAEKNRLNVTAAALRPRLQAHITWPDQDVDGTLRHSPI